MKERIKTTILRPDKKGRITLNKLMIKGTSSFRAIVDEKNRIILEPQVDIPLSESWLYNNPIALEAVKQGLTESKDGKLENLGSFAQYTDTEIE